nr:glutamate synthase central domain-containing protein [bacterium]
ILLQIPDAFFRKVCASLPFDLPPAGEYGVGMVFLPSGARQLTWCVQMLENTIRAEGQELLGWREVPNHESAIGRKAREVKPVIRQVFIRRGPGVNTPEEFERRLYLIRKVAEKAARDYREEAGYFYIPSLSCKTIVYKGLLIAKQIDRFYPDLTDPAMVSALALVHQRYSTNTFPTWDLAHPFRYLAHNGEINTLRGNINWMHARQSLFQSDLFGRDIAKLFPVCTPNASDSATLDNALELLVLGGRALDHAIMMLIPEAWTGHESMSQAKKDFYEYHSCLMEPWDGPASIAFTDGHKIGAVLDRNGLRPSRYVVTHDDFVVMASEAGVLDIDPQNIQSKGRLQPGRMFFIDTLEGRIVDDEEIKERMAARQPYGRWLQQHRVRLREVNAPAPVPAASESPAPHLQLQQAFGYTEDDLKFLLIPMARDGQEPVGSMGNDTPLAVLSDRPMLLYNYFKQLFAQVTNPPIDPIREELVMSLESNLGSEKNLLSETPGHCHQLKLDQPVLTSEDMDKIRHALEGRLKVRTLKTFFPAACGPSGLEKALDQLCGQASQAVKDGVEILILSDRGVNEERVPIPALLATSAVHHHLIREGTRTRVGLVVESGEPREVMHFALLIGYGAGGVYPYLAYETIRGLVEEGRIEGETDPHHAVKNFVKSIDKGLLKVFSK